MINNFSWQNTLQEFTHDTREWNWPIVSNGSSGSFIHLMMLMSFTVATPNNPQTGRLYSINQEEVATKCLRTQLAFSHWWHQSASNKWLTLQQFDTCRSRIKDSEEYYCNVMLLKQFLSPIRHISSEFFILQQNSAPAHRTLDGINLWAITLPNVDELFKKFFESRLCSKFVINTGQTIHYVWITLLHHNTCFRLFLFFWNEYFTR